MAGSLADVLPIEILPEIDRQELADTFAGGTALVAHSFLSPNQPEYREIEARLPRGISARSIAEPELEWSRQWTTLGISARPASLA